MFKKILASTLIASALVLVGCGDNGKTESASAAKSTYKIGVCPGPYGKMITDAITPSLNKRGIEVEIVEFTDYVQPDMALDGGDLDANLMQHTAYLNGMIQNNGLKLARVIDVPTLGLGIFSDKVTSFDQLKRGDKVALPNDAVNLARALRIARDVGLITLKAESDENKASVHDVANNKYKLEFVLMEAAQISRSFDSVALGFVPGNYAVAANLDYNKALGVEDVKANTRNVVAVHQDNVDTIGKVLEEVVSSQEFKDAINGNDYYQGFTRPDWWNE